MQVIAAIFIASSSGYEVTVGNILIISVLALIASIGTPAAPGAGAIILFTVLTGMGYQNDAAVLAYSLILAINRHTCNKQTNRNACYFIKCSWRCCNCCLCV